MTGITYSSAAGRLPKEIQVLEHPSSPGNVAEPPFKILEPSTTLDPSENPVPESCRVKGQRWLEHTGNEGGAKAEPQRHRWGRGVSKRMERGRREEPCDLGIDLLFPQERVIHVNRCYLFNYIF